MGTNDIDRRRAVGWLGGGVVAAVAGAPDVWYRTQKDTYEGLATSRVFDEAEMEQVCRGNALRLMPPLATL